MRLTLIAVLALLAGLVRAQNWRVVAPDPLPRAYGSMEFDPNQQRLLLVGGQTGQFTLASTMGVRVGNRWNEVITAPSPRQSHGMAVDPQRRRVVVFGGWNGATLLSDTLEWDGNVWTTVPTGAPPQINGPVLCWHGGTSRVVLYGMDLANAPQTWNWDGTNWTPLQPALQPPPRQGHAMAYDLPRDRVVMFGGTFGFSYVLGTWEWDGSNWTQIPVAAEPPGQFPAMAYDLVRARTVLFGNGTWEYDGTNWTQRSTAVAPATRFRGQSLAYALDRSRCVMHGGVTMTTALAGAPEEQHDTWEWDGSQWTPDAPVPSPGKRNDVTTTIEPATGCALIHGGLGYRQLTNFTDTMRLTADGWQQVSSGNPLAPLFHACIVGDEARGEVMAFPATTGNDRTWVLRGNTWTPLQPGTQPSVRAAHAMAFDPQRGIVVLFGGAAPNTPFTEFGDTWEWNGTAWTQQMISGPGPRSEHLMAWDPAGGGVLLFGGFNYSGQTWRYTAAGWQLVATSGPTGRWLHAMATDRVRNVIVLVSGFDQAGPTPPNDHWEWNGTQWNLIGTVPMTATWHLIDSRRGAVLVLDGLTYEFQAPRARAVPFGIGCAGSAGIPRLAAGGLPELGTGKLDIALDHAMPNALALLAFDFASPGPGTGCSLLVTNVSALISAVTSGNGNATWRLQVPDRAVLRGMRLFQQAGVLDPAGGFGQVALSNGLDLLIER